MTMALAAEADAEGVAAAVAAVAADVKAPRTLDALGVILIDDPDEDVQVAAIHALGEIAGTDAERVLSAVLARPEERLVEAAHEALAGVRMLAVDQVDQVEREDEEL
ncbi:MAG: HEAT repeat domain-containing protein [Proteobacteria bacterium]|nr:HEAT repeat domain-containing protein [Pseudomonadota bacterium]